jgi:hypothetical protein
MNNYTISQMQAARQALSGGTLPSYNCAVALPWTQVFGEYISAVFLKGWGYVPAGIVAVIRFVEWLKGKPFPIRAWSKITVLVLGLIFAQFMAYRDLRIRSANVVVPKPPPRWTEPPSVQTGPIGPITAVEVLQEFEKLPKPCVGRVRTAEDTRELGGTLVWILQYGAGCRLEESPTPPDINAPQPPPIPGTSGLVIRWKEQFKPGEGIAHFFDFAGFRVRISHDLPRDSPPNSVWIDIGPGSPMK